MKRPLNKHQQMQIVRHISRFSPKMQEKVYIAVPLGRLASQLPPEVQMGWGIKIKVPKIKLKSIGKFFSGVAKAAVKAVGDVIREGTKVVGNVVTITERAYQDVKDSVIKVMPPFLRPYVGIMLAPLEFIGNPKATIENLSDDLTVIAKDIRTGVVGQLSTKLYQDVARPTFRVVRNIVNEVAIKPTLLVVDKSAAALLPTSIRDRLSEITNVAAMAGKGKLTDKDITEAMEATVQLGVLPVKVAGRFSNDVINTLKKDAILGPFLNTIDKYTGGLITSGQNLAQMPDDIYHDRNIDWKARIIDGLKIYLASVTVNQLIQSTVTSAVGEETGLNKTALGRGVLTAGSMYYGGYGKQTLTEVGKNAAVQTAKSETVKHAVANKWVDNQFAARMILSAGGKMYGVVGSDKTLLDTMSEIHDHEFQKYVDYMIKKETGLPLQYSHLVDVYNTDWATLADQVANAMSKLKPTPGSPDESFLASMGQNFVDEIKRVPGNFSNISADVLAELQRSPANLAKFGQAVAAEAVRTPENIAQIANNIATESMRAAQNVATEASKAPTVIVESASNVITEAAKAPEVIAETSQNVLRETGRAISNVADEASRIDPSLSVSAPSIPNLEKLVQQFGPAVIALLQERHPGWTPQMPITEGMMQTIEASYGKKSGGLGWLAGLVGLAALGYIAVKDE